MKYPEIHDLVSVTIDQVEYYGYVYAIDKEWQNFRLGVEFYPKYCMWFDLGQCKLVEYPKEIKSC